MPLRDSDEISSQGNHEVETKKAPLASSSFTCACDRGWLIQIYYFSLKGRLVI